MTMTKEQEEIQKMIEDLLRVATRNKIVVAGFAFSGEPPYVSNFGNCSDSHSLKLYETLVGICEGKRKAGKAILLTVGEVH
jgi:hypothetical protein